MRLKMSKEDYIISCAMCGNWEATVTKEGLQEMLNEESTLSCGCGIDLLEHNKIQSD